MIDSSTMTAAVAALRSAGLLADSIEFDGVLHRVPTSAKPSSKNGAYIAYGDAPASLWWQDWASGESGTWTAKGENTMTASEKAELSRRMEEARKAREAEQARVHAETAEKAKAIYDAAVDCTEHPYLERKGVTICHGLKLSTAAATIGGVTFPAGALLVPSRGETGNLTTLQYINAEGEKRFFPGGKKGFFPIGKDADKPLIICEGLATGLSLYECVGLPVRVAFDAGNLLLVAEVARARYPERVIIVAADYDDPCKAHPTPGGTGVAKATAAAVAVGGTIVVPRHGGRACDWNDLHKLMGAGEVRVQFMTHRKPDANVADGTDGSDSVDEQESRILPPPPPVPLETFPPSVSAMLEEAAEAFTVPLQIPATCLLGVLSCLVGGTRLISLRPSWKEPGNIWIATVAASGIGKTPCAAAFFAPVKRLEYEAFRQWQDEYARYENEVDLVRKERARAKRGEPMPDRPIQPKRRQAYIDDATVEALGEVLSDNPRGIMWRKDELAGLIADLDKYSSGNSGGGTRSRLLSSYDGQEWKTSRTSNPARNLYIPHAYVGIFGGIQPAMLPTVFEAGSAGIDEASGFLQRFMLIRAEREKPGYWTERYLSPGSEELLASIAAALWTWDIEYDAEGREVEKVVPVSSQAKAAFIEWFNGITQEEFVSPNAALLSKLKGQAQRLCLLLHCLDAALAGTDGMGIVTEDCMRRALLLADWVKEHQEQCWRFFTPEKGTKQAAPIEHAIMQVVVDEAANIEARGWRISNADLCSLVEAKMNMLGLSSVKIGKAASGLGMGKCKVDRNSKGRSVTKELIDSFKSTVRFDRNPHGSRDKIADGCHFEPTATDCNALLSWMVESTADGSLPDADLKKSVDTQSMRSERTMRSVDSGHIPEFNFNDPAYLDEDRVEL